jgi:hypothetical protein
LIGALLRISQGDAREQQEEGYGQYSELCPRQSYRWALRAQLVASPISHLSPAFEWMRTYLGTAKFAASLQGTTEGQYSIIEQENVLSQVILDKPNDIEHSFKQL